MSRSNIEVVCPHCGKHSHLTVNVNMVQGWFDVGVVDYNAEDKQNDRIL